MNTTDNTPLTGPPPSEVPLTDPPLERVIAQVRFPLLASVERREVIASFQEAIRKEYPVLRPEQSRGIVMGPKGIVDVMNTQSSTIWRFYDVENAWRLTLAPGFLALETKTYTSRDDFLRRFGLMLEALKEHFEPPVIDRVGVRYIDRIVGNNLKDLATLVRPEVAGILATPLAEQARHSISENMFMLPDDAGELMARWGRIPAGSTVDPAAIKAIDEDSWILDIDASRTETNALDVEAVIQQARGFAERIYSVFRWAVTDEFLRRYGGQP